MAASPELTGGSGLTFEDAVVGYYLTALLSQTAARGLNGAAPDQVRVQRGALGHPLDDLAVSAQTPSGPTRLDLQVKRSFAFKAHESNTDFFDVIAYANTTLADPSFRTGIDRLGVATDEIDAGHYRQVRTVCEWARDSLGPEDFLLRIGTAGVSSKAKQAVVAATREGLARALGRPAQDDEVHRLLRHFLLLRFDLLDEGASELDPVLDRLNRALTEAKPSDALDLWRNLRTLAREASGRAGAFDRDSLRLKLGAPERFATSHPLTADIVALQAEAQLAFSTIERGIDGLVVPRPTLLETVEAGLSSHRIIQIGGQPGAGKSALLRAVVERRTHEPMIGLRSDRIAAGGWPTYARALGLDHATPTPILREMACAGEPVLFIDGLDRVVGAGRALVKELVGAVLDDPALARWRIVATLRDGGWEHVRRWLPAVSRIQPAVVEVGGLTDAEAELVAAERPRLGELLYGERTVREIARRPFFLSVLACAIDLEGETPSSETELIAAWWAGGGYAAEGAERSRRQAALIALAEAGAANLGRAVRVRGLDHDALESLKTDRLVVDLDAGHTVSFAHDIFFEWAFTHRLVDAEADWRQVLIKAGEPPALGRPVELLSQRRFERDQDWQGELLGLEASGTRSQWRRAWLIAPLSSPQFWGLGARFSQALFAGDGTERLCQLLTWFQAVRAKPGERAWQALSASLSEPDAVRLADALSGPDDIPTWARFLHWLVGEQTRIPPKLWPAVLTCAEVWQNSFSTRRNAVSEGLLTLARGWLTTLEEHRSEQPGRRVRSIDDLDHETERSLALTLRTLILGAAVSYPERIQDYMAHLLADDQAAHDAIETVIAMAVYVAHADAQALADLVLKQAIQLLPRAQMQREIEDDDRRRAKALEYPEGSRERDLLMPSGFGGGIDYWDWDHLSVSGLDQHIQIPSPIAQPFHALFQADADLALKTVKTLCNHAVAAWRELHDLDPEQGQTPLPLPLDFPWGRETFWGDEREYQLYRGVFSPQIITTSLMVLEDWALNALEGGADLEVLLRKILKGAEHNALLGVASTLAVARPAATATTLPMITSHRLWLWDIGRLSRVETGGRANEIAALGRRRELVALKATNGRPERGLWIGSLAALFVTGGDEALAQASQEAIGRFGQDPALDYAEEAQDEALVAERRRRGASWSTFADPNAYTVEPVEGGVQIQARQPPPTDPADIREVEALEQTKHWIALSMWALRVMGEDVQEIGLSDEAAIAEAQRLDAADLFEQMGAVGDLEDLRRAGVAGAAAFVLREVRYQDEALLAWAEDVIVRALDAPLGGDGLTFANTILTHHPLKYVPTGLAGIVRRERPLAGARPILIQLIGCWVHEVGVAAARAAYSLADVQPGIALAALQLAVTMAIRTDTPLARHRDRQGAAHTRETAVLAAINAALAVAAGEASFSLPALPERHDDEERDPRARLDDEVWLDTAMLAKHLEALEPTPAGFETPLAALSASLLNWTISHAAEDGRRGRSSLIVWRGHLMRWMAWRALPSDAAQIIDTILAPICAQEDEACLALLSPFIGVFAARQIHDAEIVEGRALTVMLAAARRAATLRSGGRWTSGSTGDQLFRDLLCAAHTHAPLARRFANGDWSELAVIWPVLDILLPAQKGRADFAHAWLTLVEQAHSAYPLARFAAEALNVLEALPAAKAARGEFRVRLGAVLQTLLERDDPIDTVTRERLLRILDILTDHGDRRAALLQRSEQFRLVARES